MEHLEVAEAKKQNGRTDSRKEDEIGQILPIVSLDKAQAPKVLPRSPNNNLTK